MMAKTCWLSILTCGLMLNVHSAHRRVSSLLSVAVTRSFCMSLWGPQKKQHGTFEEFPTRDAFENEIARRSQGSAKPFRFTLMTYNMCSPVEIQKNPELYKKYAWSKRLPRMKELILSEGDTRKFLMYTGEPPKSETESRNNIPTFLCLQEIRHEGDVKATTELPKALGSHYDFITVGNDPGETTFFNTIGFDRKQVFCDNVQWWWSTNSENPNQCGDSFGKWGWGKVTVMARFYPIIPKVVRGNNIISPDYDAPPVYVVNAHRGMRHIERINAHRVDVEEIRKRVKEKNAIILLAGDFNTFLIDNGSLEMEFLTNSGYKELLSLKTEETNEAPKGIRVSGTFPGYDYDKFRSKPGTFADQSGDINQLDHVMGMCKGSDVTVLYYSYVNAKRYNGKPEVVAICEADLLKTAGTESCEFHDFPSDHLPGIVHAAVMSNK